jgi:hypothetical protein
LFQPHVLTPVELEMAGQGQLLVGLIFAFALGAFLSRLTDSNSMPVADVIQRHVAKEAKVASPHSSCRWVFVQYHPSPLEERWSTGVAHYQHAVCDAMRTEFKSEFAEYESILEHLPTNNAPNESALPAECATRPRQPRKFDERVFSRFEYGLKCDGVLRADQPRQFVFIEPLAGMLRHPLVCESPLTYMLNKQYLLIDEWAAHRDDEFIRRECRALSVSSRGDHQVRSFYFDLGASLWTTGFGGASQSWFYYTYHQCCIDFDRFLMWEGKKENRIAVFEQIPGPVKPRYHWYNVHASPSEGSWRNPLTSILSEARVDDFVMLKIDIDSPLIELQLLTQIVENPTLAALIDELFFEHHVNVEIMRTEWALSSKYPVYQNESLSIFSRLRALGIRAHSWV